MMASSQWLLRVKLQSRAKVAQIGAITHNYNEGSRRGITEEEAAALDRLRGEEDEDGMESEDGEWGREASM